MFWTMASTLPPHKLQGAARDRWVADQWRAGRTYTSIAKDVRLSSPRVGTLVSRELGREAAKYGCTRREVEMHYRPRKAGKRGDGYSSAATIAQRRALAEWEKIAHSVEDAQDELDRVGLSDVRAKLDATKAKAEAEAKFKEDCRLVDEAHARIRRIKQEYDSLDLSEKKDAHEILATRIDIKLDFIRSKGFVPFAKTQ